jgi:hypothetical protein
MVFARVFGRPGCVYNYSGTREFGIWNLVLGISLDYAFGVIQGFPLLQIENQNPQPLSGLLSFFISAPLTSELDAGRNEKTHVLRTWVF